MKVKTTVVADGIGLVIPAQFCAPGTLGEEVELSLVPGGLLLRPSHHSARSGWARAIAQIPPDQLAADEQQLRAVRESPTCFDLADWQW